MKVRKRLMLFLKGFVMISILWYIIAAAVNIKVLPKPTEIYFNIDRFYSDKIYIHILVSVYRVISGLAISLTIGIPLGMLMAYSKFWNRLLNPLVYFTYPIPKTALIPIVMLLFGLGDISKITIIVLIVVFQIIVAVRDSVFNIFPENYELIKSLGASKLQIFINITFPAILPELLTNIRVSIGTALSVLFFTESYGTNYGIGYYIIDSWSRIDYINMYLGIVGISFLGFFLFTLIDVIEEMVCKWKSIEKI